MTDEELAELTARAHHVLDQRDQCLARIERIGRDVDLLDAELEIKVDLEDQLRDLMEPDVVRYLLRIPEAGT